jgi:hypothetical protein
MPSGIPSGVQSGINPINNQRKQEEVRAANEIELSNPKYQNEVALGKKVPKGRLISSFRLTNGSNRLIF